MKNNFLSIIDYGSKKIRLTIYDNNRNLLHSSYTEQADQENIEERSKKIVEIIKNAEKKISSHIENCIVLLDDPELLSIDISFKKNYDKEVIIKDQMSSLNLEAEQQVKDNYSNFNIVNSIISKYRINDTYFVDILDDKVTGDRLVLDFKFLCLPTSKYNYIKDVFNKSNLNILNLFSGTFVRSSFYRKKFKNYNSLYFLEIGWERSTLIFFNKNTIEYIKNIKIGGNHITKDISKIFKINLQESEKIKEIFHSSEEEFSYEFNDRKKNLSIKNLMGHEIDTDMLKQVVLARIQEILNFCFKETQAKYFINKFEKGILVLIGEGSKILSKNSFDFEDKYSFTEIISYTEETDEICEAGLEYYLNNKNNISKNSLKNTKKTGLFEKFFNLFSN